MNILEHDLYGGISGAELSVDNFEMGYGITLSKTYAHLMAPFMMAFSPAPPGKHHPTPWKAASGGFGFDVVAQIHIPKDFYIEEGFDRLNSIWWFAALLRFKASHILTIPVISTQSFTLAKEYDGDIQFIPIEIDPQRMQLITNPSILLEEDLFWVKEHWEQAGKLISMSKEFSILFQTFDQTLFSRNRAMSLLWLWSAIEPIFSPARAELRFRISSNIAAYLEPPGANRLSLQKQVAKLYDARSAIAHGTSQNEDEALENTYKLHHRILMKIITDNHCPTREDLEAKLFGVDE